MKQLFQISRSATAAILMASALSIGAFSSSATPIKKVTSSDSFVDIYRELPKGTLHRMTKAPGDLSSVIVTVNTAAFMGDAFPGQVAIATQTDEGIYWQSADQLEDDKFQFLVPDGNYDVMIYYYVDNLDGGVMVTQPLEVAGESQTIEMQLSDATYRTKIVSKTPDGTVLRDPGHSKDDRLVKGESWTFIDYKGSELVMYDFMRDMKYYQTNTPNSDYHITCAHRVGCTDGLGVITAVLPIDFNKSDVSASTSNWQSTSVTFEPTPYNNFISEKYPDRQYELTMSSFMAAGLWWFSSGQGYHDAYVNTGKISTWAPDNYDGFVEILMNPTGSTFSGNDSMIKGMALMRTENGLRQIGQNLYFGRDIFTNPYNTDLRVGGNQLYQFDPNGMHIGNCAPTLVNFQFGWTSFNFAFSGRHGEDFTIDTFNLLKCVNPDYIDEYGGKCTSNILITCNGTTVCDNRFDFDPEDDWPEGKYHAEISTDNVLVDGNVPGYSQAVFEYETDYLGQSPTIAGLQFRNTEDNITDRFETGADGRVILYATQFIADYDEEAEMMWYHSANVQGIKVEAAPYNTEDYMEIPVETDPAKNYELGWGQYYEGSLEGITARSSNGWFKLRVTLNGVGGSWQTQTITPAFRILSLNNGVENVEAERTPLCYEVNGRNIIAPGAAIYDLTGTQTDGKNLNPGIYMITDGTRTAKIIVK